MASRCDFLHAHFEDDWARCPYPDQVKAYSRTYRGETDVAHYCDNAAEQARAEGFVLELLPAGDSDRG